MTTPPVLILRGTTNILTNPLFTGDGTGWTKSQLTGTTDTEVTKDGINSLRIDLTTTVTGNTYVGDFSNTVTPGNPYTFRVYVRANQSGRKCFVRLYNAPYVSATTDIATEDWTELRVTVPSIPGGVTNASALVLFDTATCQNGDRFWIVQPQMEWGTTPTPFTATARAPHGTPGHITPGTRVRPLRIGKD